jgi:hypothetical protein
VMWVSFGQLGLASHSAIKFLRCTPATLP